MTVLLKRFHLNGHIIVFLLQTKKLEQCTKQIVRDESTAEEVSFEWFWKRTTVPKGVCLRRQASDSSCSFILNSSKGPLQTHNTGS